MVDKPNEAGMRLFYNLTNDGDISIDDMKAFESHINQPDMARSLFGDREVQVSQADIDLFRKVENCVGGNVPGVNVSSDAAAYFKDNFMSVRETMANNRTDGAVSSVVFGLGIFLLVCPEPVVTKATLALYLLTLSACTVDGAVQWRTGNPSYIWPF